MPWSRRARKNMRTSGRCVLPRCTRARRLCFGVPPPRTVTAIVASRLGLRAMSSRAYRMRSGQFRATMRQSNGALPHRRNGSLAKQRTGHRSAQGLLLHVNRLTRCLVGGFRALPPVVIPLFHQGPRFRRNLNGNASSVAASPFAPGDTAPDDSAPAAGPVPCLGSGPDPSPPATA
jgi:hypothetical protein